MSSLQPVGRGRWALGLLIAACVACVVAVSDVDASWLADEAGACQIGHRESACTEAQIEEAEEELLAQMPLKLLQRELVTRKVKQPSLSTESAADKAEPRRAAPSRAPPLAEEAAASSLQARAAQTAMAPVSVLEANASVLQPDSEDPLPAVVQDRITTDHLADAAQVARNGQVLRAAGPGSKAAEGDAVPLSGADTIKPLIEDEVPTKTAGSGEATTKALRPVASHSHSGGKPKEMLQAVIPIAAIVVGGLLVAAGQRIMGMLTIYFGAQTGLSLYMKIVLSNAVVSQELQMKGVPAGFLVTAIQQVVAFFVMAFVIMLLWPTRWQYRPRPLKTFQEWATVITFSLAFAINIGLNNFSLSLMAMSLNLIIRSCAPLVTLMVQQLVGSCQPQAKKSSVAAVEVVLMLAGVAFAGLATLSKEESAHGTAESKHMVLGVFWCVLSDFACALNLVLGGMFATNLDPPLNPIDTIWYMALPAGLFLLPAAFKMSHPVDWPGFGQVTDWQIILKVFELSPQLMGLVLLSGVFAAAYNVLQYTVVQSLSATHCAFAGNFNKAATILLSMLLGLETVPGNMWGIIMVLAIVGNIASFTGYSMVKIGDKGGHGHHGHAAAKQSDQDTAEPTAAGKAA